MSVNNVNIGPIVSGSSTSILSVPQHPDRIRIGHVNCQSIKPSNYSTKFDEFSNIITDNFDLIGLSETWLKPCISSSSVAIPGFSLGRYFCVLVKFR